jgi:hypothetical protein
MAFELFQRGAVADPVSLLSDYQSKADSAYALGDYADAVLSAAIASEIQLDHTLSLMLYEESTPAAQVAGIWEKGLSWRLKHEYSHRLRGQWSQEAARWERNLSRLRGRIVHTGYRPQRQEAQAALEAHDRFVNFIFSRLIVMRLQYPWSTLLLAGRRRVEDAQHYRGKFKEFVVTVRSGGKEMPWLMSYFEWRERVDEMRVRL